MEAKLSHHLAAMLCTRQQLEEALQVSQRSLGRAQEAFGAAHPYVLLTRSSVVNCLNTMGQQVGGS